MYHWFMTNCAELTEKKALEIFEQNTCQTDYCSLFPLTRQVTTATRDENKVGTRILKSNRFTEFQPWSTYFSGTSDAERLRSKSDKILGTVPASAQSLPQLLILLAFCAWKISNRSSREMCVQKDMCGRYFAGLPLRRSNWNGVVLWSVIVTFSGGAMPPWSTCTRKMFFAANGRSKIQLCPSPWI